MMLIFHKWLFLEIVCFLVVVFLVEARVSLAFWIFGLSYIFGVLVFVYTIRAGYANHIGSFGLGDVFGN